MKEGFKIYCPRTLRLVDYARIAFMYFPDGLNAAEASRALLDHTSNKVHYVTMLQIYQSSRK